jgi:hypothetical protein
MNSRVVTALWQDVDTLQADVAANLTSKRVAEVKKRKRGEDKEYTQPKKKTANSHSK